MAKAPAVRRVVAVRPRRRPWSVQEKAGAVVAQLVQAVPEVAQLVPAAVLRGVVVARSRVQRYPLPRSSKAVAVAVAVRQVAV
ncbi:hypothetical protein ACXPWS_09405 [Mycobacterium sp. BMJ-28]